MTTLPVKAQQSPKATLAFMADVVVSMATVTDPDESARARNLVVAAGKFVKAFGKPDDKNVRESVALRVLAEIELGTLLVDGVRHQGGRPGETLIADQRLPKDISQRVSSDCQALAGAKKRKNELGF